MLTAKQKELLHRYIPNTTQDKAALTIYPFRYEIVKKWDQKSFPNNELIGFQGQILEPVKTIRFKNRAITRFQVMTDFHLISCVMYNRPYFKNVYAEQQVSIVGSFNDKNELVISSLNLKPLDEIIGIFPIYPLKKGVSQYQMRSLMKKVLSEQEANIHQMIPTSLAHLHGLFDTVETLKQIHQPSSMDALTKAINTLKYAEALRYQTALALMKLSDQSQLKPIRKFEDSHLIEFEKQLSYELTQDQKDALESILNDFKNPYVMRRLLLGDVGSGKTIVAILSALMMIEAGYQVAFLCPTEVLAQQHLKSIQEFSDQVDFLSGSTSVSDRKEILSRLKSGETKLIVGTHALFSPDVHYHNLGYVIIDEQHRFGVNQRQKMIEKGVHVDSLMMSATPIPRTLAATLFSHLSISTIEMMPQGRKQVITTLIPENSIRSILDELITFIESGQQVYVVCPAIDDDSEMTTRNVVSIEKNLKSAFKNRFVIESIHSRKSSEEIESVLDGFRKQKVDLLVSTTIIEVGVHVESANMMIIYDADRFGLSQLHQLRGRIGRSTQQGYCYVLTQSKNQESLDRLNLFVSETSGFKLAQMDLIFRGSGDLLGQRQSGYPQFTHLDLASDLKILEIAKQDAQNLFDKTEKEVTIFIQQIAKQQSSILNKTTV